MAVSYRAILRLHQAGKNKSQIERETGYKRFTIRNTISKATAAGLLPTLWRDMSEDALKKALRKKPEPKQEYLPIDYEGIHQELKDPHVTMNILHEEYEEKAKASGLISYSRTQFFDTYNVFADVVKCGAHIKRKPGDSLELDFAGDLTYYTNPHTMEDVPVVLFLASLSYSKLTFVKAIESQKAVFYINATMDAFGQIGGVTRCLTVDNTKAAVIFPSRIDLAVLNCSFKEMAAHYKVSVVPAPPYSPKSKPMVEDSVSNAYTRILAPLRKNRFYSLEELNHALQQQCETFNNEPFKEHRNWTRRSLFETEERNELSLLPAQRFEFRERATGTVSDNSHVRCRLDSYYYSVPHRWIKHKVVMKLGAEDILIYSGEEPDEFICSHGRGSGYDRYVTDRTHLPSYVRQYVYASPDMFRSMAENIGLSTYAVIDRLFSIASANGTAPETEYNTARGILGMANSSGKHPERSGHLLEECCRQLLEIHPNPMSRIGGNLVKRKAEEIVTRRKAADCHDFISGTLFPEIGGMDD